MLSEAVNIRGGNREWLVICTASIKASRAAFRIRCVSSQCFIQTNPRFGSQISASSIMRPQLGQDKGSHPKLFLMRSRHFMGTTNFNRGSRANSGVSYAKQWEHFRDLRHTDMDTLGKLNASSVQQLLRRLDKSFSAFFQRMKSSETPGFPRFKNKDRFKSIEYSYGDGCKLRSDEHGRYSFYVQNVGEIRMCYHRSIPENSKIKHVVLKCTNHRWFVCLM